MEEQIESLYFTNKIRTYTGKYIDVFDLKPEDIHIEDIARGLSNTCRFGGQLKHFYSVLQHSVSVATDLPAELKVAGLFHDGFEGLTGMDVCSPIKKRLPDYRALEENGMKVIAKRFGFEYPLHPLVKETDRKILEYEWDTYMIKQHKSTPDKEKLIEGFITLAEYFQTI